jgi:hypothetical protein
LKIVVKFWEDNGYLRGEKEAKKGGKMETRERRRN